MASPRLSVVLTPADLGITLGRRANIARMRAVADTVLAEWAAQARSRIRSPSMLAAYLRSLAIQYVDEMECAVALPGLDGPSATMARMVEFGMGPGGIGTEGAYDIRTFVLKAGTRSLRIGKSGPYVNIPFPMTTGQLKEAGKSGVGASKVLKMARALPAYKGGHSKGQGLPEGLSAKLKPHHVSDQTEGVVRKQATYSQRKDGTPVVQSTYMKWRRMSWAGKPWMHPGIKAHRIGDEVERRLDTLLTVVW
uniref:Uncharacterized protein n=1 Tax=uncultured Caudovirales phage TaxID=2100421 RepID=A0A6J5L5X5_9CAUD|nr:hypothetical protein UFOVP114_53 [uncultured Caudovirales phage]